MSAARKPSKSPAKKKPALHGKSPSLPGSARQLKRVRAICLALPETTEKIAWGAPTFRVKNKLFAMFADNHHGDGRIALWCKAPPGEQEVLVGSEPKRFFRPPYVGPSGWIGLHLGANSDEEVSAFVREAYRMTAPKRLCAALGD
jgi:hypothetical protein